MDMAIRKSQRTFTSRLAPFTIGDKKHLQQSASIMKGMAMKENDLTYELICAAVNGEKTALEEILRFYDDYINALATVKGEDAQGKHIDILTKI